MSVSMSVCLFACLVHSETIKQTKHGVACQMQNASNKILQQLPKLKSQQNKQKQQQQQYVFFTLFSKRICIPFQ